MTETWQLRIADLLLSPRRVKSQPLGEPLTGPGVRVSIAHHSTADPWAKDRAGKDYPPLMVS